MEYLQLSTTETQTIAAPRLLECLDLRNKVVTVDAMHTQRKLSIQIVAAGGDFGWIVKKIIHLKPAGQLSCYFHPNQSPFQAPADLQRISAVPNPLKNKP